MQITSTIQTEEKSLSRRERLSKYAVGQRLQVTSQDGPLILCEVIKQGREMRMSSIRRNFPDRVPFQMTVKKVRTVKRASQPRGSLNRWLIHKEKRQGGVIGYGARAVALLRLEKQEHVSITTIGKTKKKGG